jgi:hypothetical protein
MKHVNFAGIQGPRRYTPADRLDALHRVAKAARAFMRAEDDPDLQRYATRLELALAHLDMVETNQGAGS